MFPVFCVPQRCQAFGAFSVRHCWGMVFLRVVWELDIVYSQGQTNACGFSLSLICNYCHVSGAAWVHLREQSKADYLAMPGGCLHLHRNLEGNSCSYLCAASPSIAFTGLHHPVWSTPAAWLRGLMYELMRHRPRCDTAPPHNRQLSPSL